MQTAHDLYYNEVQRLPLAERLRLIALLLDELQTVTTLPRNPETTPERPRPKRGSGKHHILSMADDFTAPLEEMREYME